MEGYGNDLDQHALSSGARRAGSRCRSTGYRAMSRPCSSPPTARSGWHRGWAAVLDPAVVAALGKSDRDA